MKTLIEKLQSKLDFIRERSKQNQRLYKKSKDPLLRGYADAFELTAKWIQEIIDDDIQDRENQPA